MKFETLEEAKFAIAVDQKGNYWVAMQGASFNLPKKARVARAIASVTCKVKDIQDAIRAHDQGDFKKKNDILSQYLG